jgi:serine/threonine-protein kinase RCK2
MRGVDHPNIIKLIQFSESEEHYFLVLERKQPVYHVSPMSSNEFVVMEGGELFHQM